MKTIISFLVLAFIFTVLTGCQKEGSDKSKKPYSNTSKVNAWLDKQKSNSGISAAERIQVIKESLELDKTRVEEKNEFEKLLITPIKGKYVPRLNPDKHFDNYLILFLNKNDEVVQGGLVQYRSSDEKQLTMPAGTLSRFLSNKRLNWDFKFTYLNIDERPGYEIIYKDGAVRGFSESKPKLADGTFGKSDVVNECLEYYWNTYENGILVSSVYLGTFCTPEVEEGDGGGSSGSGNGGQYSTEYNDGEAESVYFDEEEEVGGVGYVPITYNHHFIVTREVSTNEVVSVYQDPVTASPMISFYTDKYSRLVTRRLTLYAQAKSYLLLSPTTVMMSWSCMVHSLYTYTDGSPSATTVRYHSKTVTN